MRTDANAINLGPLVKLALEDMSSPHVSTVNIATVRDVIVVYKGCLIAG
jgi:hypothetical protein